MILLANGVDIRKTKSKSFSTKKVITIKMSDSEEDFLNKLVIYINQKSHYGVTIISKKKSKRRR
jgi:hypothetical protein